MIKPQPIETAPKDGTEILGIYVPDDERLPVTYSIVLWNGYCWDGRCDGGDSYYRDYHGAELHEPTLTHWCPLPEMKAKEDAE